MSQCADVVEAYLGGLQDSIHIKAESDQVCSITTPFETVGGEPIRVYVERQGDRYILSDEGEVLGNLFMFNIKREREVAAYLDEALRRFGLHEEGGAVVRTTDKRDLRSAIVGYLNGVQQLSSLEMRKRAIRAEQFDRKVRNALSIRQVPYLSQYRLEFQSFQLSVDFASANTEYLFLAMGTAQNSDSQMLHQLRSKLYTYLQLKLRLPDSRYTRAVILDEATAWPEPAFAMARADADKVFEWPSQSDEVEAALLENAAVA